MSDLNGSGGSYAAEGGGSSSWLPKNGSRPAHAGSVDQPGEVVDRLRQMADMLAGALAQGEQKVAEAKQEAAVQIAAVQGRA